LEFAVHVPLTVSEPASTTSLQVRGSSPANVMSRFELDNDKQDDITFQVPTTSPPQGVPFGQDGLVPPPPCVPAVPIVPALEVPPVPDGRLEVAVHAAEIIPAETARERSANWNFIEGAPSLE
jgi:hypothetical protein